MKTKCPEQQTRSLPEVIDREINAVILIQAVTPTLRNPKKNSIPSLINNQNVHTEFQLSVRRGSMVVVKRLSYPEKCRTKPVATSLFSSALHSTENLDRAL